MPLRRSRNEEPWYVWCDLDEVEGLEVRHAVEGTKNIVHRGAHVNVLRIERQMSDGVREEGCGPAPGTSVKLNALERRAVVMKQNCGHMGGRRRPSWGRIVKYERLEDGGWIVHKWPEHVNRTVHLAGINGHLTHAMHILPYETESVAPVIELASTKIDVYGEGDCF